MGTINLADFLRRAEARMHELGMDTPEWQERLRNKGGNRTPEKRELLLRIAARARAAGLEPIKAY